MGNCLGSLFGTIRRKSKKNYFTGRYKEYNVGIEFESLIEDDLAQQSQCSAVTDRERDHLLNKRYSDLIQDQKRRDAEIDAELRKQEENARLEEEAYIIAKRESARAAHQARALEQQRPKPLANGTAKTSWLGDNENEWNVAGGEDDFEMFLESVKARSQSVRANVKSLFDFRRRKDRSHSKKLKHVEGADSMEWDYEEGMAPNPYNSSQYNGPVLANTSPHGNSMGPASTLAAPSKPEESDSDFEPEFVGAETTPELILTTTNDQVPTPDEPAPTKPTVGSTETDAMKPKQNGVKNQVHYGGSTSGNVVAALSDAMNIHETQSTPVPSGKNAGSESIIMITAPESTQVQNDNPSSVEVTASKTKTHTRESKTAESKSSLTNPAALVEDDPFDFDKFLEELDFDE